MCGIPMWTECHCFSQDKKESFTQSDRSARGIGQLDVISATYLQHQAHLAGVELITRSDPTFHIDAKIPLARGSLCRWS